MNNVGIGSKFGPYTITDHLGAGGAGTVFAATDETDGRQVALKIMRAGAELNEEIHSRFIREIAIAQRLNDPHILQYYDCGVDEGILYYAMEQVPWGSLDDVLRSRGTLTWREACECGEQIAYGLQHLHDAGIVHRDLKPANIFLSDEGQLKLGDFGLARDLQSHDLSMDGTTVGTAKYLAPEQAKGERMIDGRADLYALGCNLFHLVVGRTPFESENPYQPANFFEMMRRHVEQPAPKLADLVHGSPPEFNAIVEQLLAKDREDRPETAQQVAQTLAQILAANSPADHAASAENTAALEPSGEAQNPAPAPLTERLRESSAPERNAKTGMLLGVAVVLIGVVGLAIWMGNSGQ